MSQKQNDDQFSDKLGSLLSDPEMMQKIVQMAAAMKQNEEARGESDNNGSAESARASDNKTTFDEEASLEDEAPSAPVSAPPLPPLPSLHHHDANTELLRALRPYLSSRRRERVDKLLKVMKLTEMTESMKHYL